MLGGPRLLGLSELGSRQLQKQAIVIFACVLQDCKSWKVAFSCFRVYFFYIFKFFCIVFLRLCTSWNANPPLGPADAERGEWGWYSGPKPSGSVEMYSSVGLLWAGHKHKNKINTASTKRHPGHQSTPFDGGSRGWWPETFQLEVQSINIL